MVWHRRGRRPSELQSYEKPTPDVWVRRQKNGRFLYFSCRAERRIFEVGKKKKGPGGLFFCYTRDHGNKDSFHGPYDRKNCPYHRPCRKKSKSIF